MITDIGLIIIALAWVYELVLVARGDKTLKVAFVVIYAIGSAALVYNGFASGQMTEALLNVLTLALTVGVLMLWKEKVK